MPSGHPLLLVYAVIVMSYFKLCDAQRQHPEEAAGVFVKSSHNVSTDPSFNNDICSVIRCMNGGVCQGSSINDTTCACSRFFTGTVCEEVDLLVPGYHTDSNSVTLTWPGEIDLSHYYCFYIRMQHVSWLWIKLKPMEYLAENIDDLHKVKLADNRKNSTTIIISGLRGDATRYTMCFIHQDYIPNTSDSTSVITAISLTNSNCIAFVTSYGGGIYTEIAKYVSLAMGVSVVLLFILRGIDNCRDPNTRALFKDEIQGKISAIKKASNVLQTSQRA